MEQYVIRGGKPLEGEVVIAGAKNAAFLAMQILALSDEKIAKKLLDLSEEAIKMLEKDSKEIEILL